MSSSSCDCGMWIFILFISLFLTCNNVGNNSKKIKELEQKIEQLEKENLK